MDWFDDVNDEWLDVIEAMETTTTTTTVTDYVCRCSNEYGSWEYPVFDPSQCNSTDYETCTVREETRTTTSVQFSTEPSDGVVPNTSAIHLTGATSPPFELENSSHMQMRNDENMRDALQDLFDEESDLGEFWKIAPR